MAVHHFVEHVKLYGLVYWPIIWKITLDFDALNRNIMCCVAKMVSADTDGVTVVNSSRQLDSVIAWQEEVEPTGTITGKQPFTAVYKIRTWIE